MRQSIVGDLVARSFDLYRRHFGLVLSLTLPVVVVVFVLTALGLGELNASYRTALPLRDFWIEEAASQIVTTPLITAMLARFVLLEQRGERISATDLLAGALEAFPAVLLVVLVWLTVSVALFAILILPGVYFAVSWFFVVQAVVIDGDRGLAPLTRSASLVRLRWWRSAGVGLAFQVLVTLASAVIGAVFPDRERGELRCGLRRRRHRRRGADAAVPRDRRDALLPAAARVPAGGAAAALSPTAAGATVAAPFRSISALAGGPGSRAI